MVSHCFNLNKLKLSLLQAEANKKLGNNAISLSRNLSNEEYQRTSTPMKPAAISLEQIETQIKRGK